MRLVLVHASVYTFRWKVGWSLKEMLEFEKIFSQIQAKLVSWIGQETWK